MLCSFDLNKIAQAQGDKTARKQSIQLRKEAVDSLAEVSARLRLHVIKLFWEKSRHTAA